MLGKLFGGLGRWLGVRYAQQWLRNAAEGKLGPRWQAAYWWTVGRKTYWGFALLLVTVALTALGEDKLTVTVGVVGGVLVTLGLLDKGWRGETPRWFLESRFYQLLAAHGADIAAGFGYLAYRLEGCAAQFAWDLQNCALWSRMLVVMAGLLVYFNVIPAAWRARPPQWNGAWDERRGVSS